MHCSILAYSYELFVASVSQSQAPRTQLQVVWERRIIIYPKIVLRLLGLEEHGRLPVWLLLSLSSR